MMKIKIFSRQKPRKALLFWSRKSEDFLGTGVF